jgi:2-polyprenyl-6-hydroxyphenyl methylase/3-demethylubiquinone-9 3-methyltransferase
MVEAYDRTWHASGATWEDDPTIPLKRRLLLEMLSKQTSPGSRVLDLGCGTGRFTALMTEAGYRVTAADVSAEAISVARTNAPDCETLLLQPDEQMPLPSGTFDAVWASEVIEHLVDVGQFAKDVFRVLRPGGSWILTTPFHGVAKNLLIALLKFDRHFDPGGPHLRFFDRRGLDRVIRSAGFQPILCRGIGRCWPIYRNFFAVAQRP